MKVVDGWRKGEGAFSLSLFVGGCVRRVGRFWVVKEIFEDVFWCCFVWFGKRVVVASSREGFQERRRKERKRFEGEERVGLSGWGVW